jgi:hypothetical protein
VIANADSVCTRQLNTDIDYLMDFGGAMLVDVNLMYEGTCARCTSQRVCKRPHKRQVQVCDFYQSNAITEKAIFE